MRPTFTLGIEEEYQTIDPETRDLKSHIATEMLAQGKLRLDDRLDSDLAEIDPERLGQAAGVPARGV